ncbi:MAG: hypothetical protein AB1393_08665 [Candidatus Edwardsbacteria bacterium]
MKRTIIIAVALLMSASLACPLLAQETGEAGKMLGGLLDAGVGASIIDGELYYRIKMKPEISFGKLGVGIELDLLLDGKTGKVRKVEWNEKRDYAKIIRFIRYGAKHERIYARIGALDAATLGHGFIMYRYSNQIDDNNRKIGLQFDLNFKGYGFETVTSNLGRKEILGFRSYVRPLILAKKEIPFLKRLAFGFSSVADFDPDCKKDTKYDQITVTGLDAELPLINWTYFYSALYADWAHIKGFGSGAAAGLGVELKGIMNLFEFSGRLETRNLGSEFLPSYFNAFYERERYDPFNPSRPFKSMLLSERKEKKSGYFAEIVGTVLNTIKVCGNYQRYNKGLGGLLHLEAEPPPNIIRKASVKAYYDQTDIHHAKEIFKPKKLENTLVTVEAGYEVTKYLFLIVTYQRTYVWTDKDEKGNDLTPLGYQYRSVEKISPRLECRFRF